MTRGRWTFTSYLGKTERSRGQTWGGGVDPKGDPELRPTVFLDVEAVGDPLPFVRLGVDGVVALSGLGDDGMFEVQDASVDGLVQPLGDAVPVGILRGGRSSVRVWKNEKKDSECGGFFGWGGGLTSSSTSLY